MNAEMQGCIDKRNVALKILEIYNRCLRRFRLCGSPGRGLSATRLHCLGFLYHDVAPSEAPILLGEYENSFLAFRLTEEIRSSPLVYPDQHFQILNIPAAFRNAVHIVAYLLHHITDVRACTLHHIALNIALPIPPFAKVK